LVLQLALDCSCSCAAIAAGVTSVTVLIPPEAVRNADTC